MREIYNRPFAEVLADYAEQFGPLEVQPEPCPHHPEKVRKDNIVDALDGLIDRLNQPGSRVTYAYKCLPCQWWHYTSKPRSKAPRHPFPYPFWYGVVKSGRVLWQSRSQREADRFARWRWGASVVPFVAFNEKRRAAKVLDTFPRLNV